MKDKGVCKGCKYHVGRSGLGKSLNDTCRYMDLEGHSRLKVEYENGGYKTDSCCCYVPGKAKRRIAPIILERKHG